ncbi:HAD family hydrolase [Deinococcus hopiensis]|uniref:Putative hydrolase of the HAD superfamily n=1 Tax=Deinococcus hopiensis KR-140 TaxID=695939 RepID=A0A1W1VEU8_9DEIO|nr:HAD family hydrolase [Deinococcus hopiensis]SMB91855.1 putative hydrolase of the HAD superfamily [Deinococcus hopiensis KR-140]
MTRSVRAVLFDLDGTLHDRAATIREWLVGHTGRHALPAGYAERFTELDDFGYRPKREVMFLLAREFGLTHDPEVLLEDFWAHAFRAPVPMPHTHDVLRELRARGVLVGIVTNGWADKQRQTLVGLRLEGLVDDVVISKEVGLSKPDASIYRLALGRLGVDAAATWFVGDSPRNDVWGPQQVGMRAAYLPTGHGLNGEVPEATLRNVRDVLDLISDG